MGRVLTTESLGGVMVSTLAQNARDVGSIPDLGALFPIYVRHLTLVAMTMIQAVCCMVVEPTPVYVCTVTAYMYIVISIKRLTIPGGRVE